jgi:hypothetical protein
VVGEESKHRWNSRNLKSGVSPVSKVVGDRCFWGRPFPRPRQARSRYYRSRMAGNLRATWQWVRPPEAVVAENDSWGRQRREHAQSYDSVWAWTPRVRFARTGVEREGDDPTKRGVPMVALVCSSGGHLAQLHNLRPWWGRVDRFWVTFRGTDSQSLLSGERVIWAHQPTTRNVPNLLRNGVLAWKVLRRYRPCVLVSTGAGVAFPFFLAARLLRIKTIYVEVFDRIDSRTLTGRLCYPLSSLFLLQWEEQRVLYPRGIVIGPLL